MFHALRDILIERNGSWSIRAVIEMADVAGYRVRREVAGAAIKKACGESTKTGGPRPANWFPKDSGNQLRDTKNGTSQLVPDGTSQLVPDGTSQLVPETVPEPVTGSFLTGSQEKEKKQKKKNIYITPRDTSYLSAPLAALKPIEADAERFVQYLIGLNATSRLSQSVALAALATIGEKLVEYGPQATSEALRITIGHGAKIEYFRAVVRSIAERSKHASAQLPDRQTDSKAAKFADSIQRRAVAAASIAEDAK